MADSEKIRILLDQGLTAYGLGNVDEALRIWKSVLAMDPENTRAREYLRFVEENWGPRQVREEGVPKPYRPDEGSGEILSPDNQPAESAPEQPFDGIDIDMEMPPEDHGSFEKDAFTPPAKPILQGDQWGDLYDFGKNRTAGAEQKAAPQPDPATPPVLDLAEEPEPAGEVTPEQAKIEPLAGDWSGVLTPEEQAQHPPADSPPMLPPHPGEVQEIEILEELEPEPMPEPIPAQPAVVEDFMTRDQLAPTKKYESVPTAVRPPEEVIPVEAMGTPSPPVEQENVTRDSFDRFPTDPEPLEPEPGVGFFQTPRPETTPPLGSPILQPDDSDLLDLVAGGGGSFVEAAAVPGIVPASEVDSLLKGARDMLELDDFSGAMELLDKVLEQEPEHPQASRMRGEAERELLSMLSSKLGDLNRTPRIRMSQDEIIWLNLDNRAGFVLSLMDGSLSLDEILSICGLPQLEGMRILVQLLQDKVIEIG
jgi:tetratricopeptide (TPR) repeat protein